MSWVEVEVEAELGNRIKQIEEEIGDRTVESYHKDIVETIKGLGGDETSLNGGGRKQLWNLLKQNFPKSENVILVGKMDRKSNVITNHIGLKHLYLETYVNRLRNRPIREDFVEVKQLKQLLFKLRMEISKTQRTKLG